jgi:di/tricarboxylate transporter
MTTLVGTSTNLVVSGLMVDAGSKPMGMFEITTIGLPAAIIGVIFLILTAGHLLPDREDASHQIEGESRKYLIDMIIANDSPLIGKTIVQAGLRGLKGLYLVHIERTGTNNRSVRLTGRRQILEAGDRLQFTGLVSTIVDLKKIKGLIPAEQAELFNEYKKDSRAMRLFEVVVAQGSPLVGLGIREAGFRNTYNAVVIAVHRSGSLISSKIGDIILKPGDVLMLEAPKSFTKRWYNSTHFYLVSKVADITPVNHEKFNFTAVVVAIMILLPALGIIPMVASAFAAASILILGKVLTAGSAKRSINLSVLIIIASALGIGKAVENTGLASLAASLIIDSVNFMGPIAVLAALMVITNIFAELVTNQASAAMFFPVAVATATQLSYPMDSPQMRAFEMCIALAAAASFATPLGYQTNLIVYGPGGYKYSDFFKIGSLMNILIIATGATSAYYFFFR